VAEDDWWLRRRTVLRRRTRLKRRTGGKDRKWLAVTGGLAAKVDNIASLDKTTVGRSLMA
jgi:hypothetical protein